MQRRNTPPSQSAQIAAIVASINAAAAAGTPVMEKRACGNCGRLLIGQRSDARYCGDTCRQQAHRLSVTAVTNGRPHGHPHAYPIPAETNRCTAEVSRLSAHSTRSQNRQKTAPSAARIAGPTWLIDAVWGPADRTVVSSDGVVCQVWTIRPRALATNGGGKPVKAAGI
jgi:hypothetical protein